MYGAPQCSPLYLISTVKSLFARASGSTFCLRVIHERVISGISLPLALTASV
jgi:hypothetical protein